MTVGEAFRKYTSLFQDQGMADAADEVRVLACHVLGISSARFFAQPDRVLMVEEQSALEALAERRLRGEPSAYITGSREFYGIDLHVDRRVLIPRPETEVLVAEAIEFSTDWVKRNRRSIRIADVGTGTGAVAIALALNLPDAAVCAVDVSHEALQVAERNVTKYGLSQRIELIHADLLNQIEGQFDLIVANLPYIAQDDLISLAREIREFEPAQALDGGKDGTSLIRQLISQAAGKLRPGGALMMELGAGQADRVRRAAVLEFPKAEIRLARDLAGIDRVIMIKPRHSQLRQLLNTFIKYLIVGLPNAVIYFGSIYLLTDMLKLWYMLSVGIAVILQAVTAFLLHRVWTWRHKKVALASPVTAYRFIKFMLVNIGGILLGLALIYLFTDFLQIWYMASTVASSCILQGLTFLANNYWTWGGGEARELRRLEAWLKKPAVQSILNKFDISTG